MNRLNQIVLLLVVTLALCLGAHTAERPNVILIMVDDMGFSDIGAWGGEINTPNIDALAAGGVRFSQFYNAGRCCPTRATLLTGLHPHQVGIGHMTNPPHNTKNYAKPPAYQGYLNRNCVTLAEALAPAGYSTLMTGKWHLGYNEPQRWPLQRGFEKYYGCISGATRFFHPIAPRDITFGNEQLENLESTTDRPYYTTDAFTDYAKPFFLYLAYTAPHWPLQAHEEDIARYRGRYKLGWDKLRRQRLARMKEIGLIGEHVKLSPRDKTAPAWDTLDAKKQDEMDLKMAVYAAMIDRIDQNIGKLVASLKAADRFDNTLIFFLSDNGGCQEGGVLGRGEFYDIEKRNQQSANSYGLAWANASNTPFRLYKHFNHEGGIATPFFMHWPDKIKPQKEWYREPAQLIDVMPTILEVAGAEYPSNHKGFEIPALDGVSLMPAAQGVSLNRGGPFFIEHENNATIRDGDWKLVGQGVTPAEGLKPEKWELYNIAEDRAELNDLSKKMPEKMRAMSHQWQEWAKRAQVFPKVYPKKK
ncbi:MAG: arylsulfatase [Planctomycetota bacterium]|jgi:arylsulfatase